MSTQQKPDSLPDGLLGMPVEDFLVFIEMGRPAHCGWPHSLAGILDRLSGESKLHVYIALSLTEGAM